MKSALVGDWSWKDMNLSKVKTVGEVISWVYSKKISNDQQLIQSDHTSCPQNQIKIAMWEVGYAMEVLGQVSFER